MISRARSSGGFLVLRPATRKELSSRPLQYLLDELNRLCQLEAQSHQELVDYIGGLPLEVPAMVTDILRLEAPNMQMEHVACARAGNTAYRPSSEASPGSNGFRKRTGQEQTLGIKGTECSPRKRMREKTRILHEAPLSLRVDKDRSVATTPVRHESGNISAAGSFSNDEFLREEVSNKNGILMQLVAALAITAAVTRRSMQMKKLPVWKLMKRVKMKVKGSAEEECWAQSCILSMWLENS